MSIGAKLASINNNGTQLNTSEMLRILVVDPATLIDNEKNFYQMVQLDDLIESFATSGQLEPIVVENRAKEESNKKQYVIISGHRRKKALIKYNELVAKGEIAGGKLQARIIVKEYFSAEESELELLVYNAQRIKTTEERDIEIKKYHELYTRLKETNPEKYGTRSFNIVKKISEDMSISPATIKRVINNEVNPVNSKKNKEKIANKNKVKNFIHEYVMDTHVDNDVLRGDLVNYIIKNDQNAYDKLCEDIDLKSIYIDENTKIRIDKKEAIAIVEKQFISQYFNNL